MRFKTLEGMNLDKIFRPLHSVYRYRHGFKRILAPDRKKVIEANKWKGIHGFDTETDSKGNVYLVSCSVKQNQTEFAKEMSLFSQDSYVLFSFLLEHGYGYLNWFYNIQFDFDALIKDKVVAMSMTQEGRDEALESAKNGEYILEQIGHKPLKVKFIQGKYFEVSNGKHQAYFYDCSNFYEGSLDVESNKYLGYGKEAFGVSENQIDISKGSKELGYSLCRKRCEADSKLTRLLAEKLFYTMKTELRVIPRHWNSKASLSQAVLIDRVEEKFLKPFKDFALHREVLEHSFRSYTVVPSQ